MRYLIFLASINLVLPALAPAARAADIPAASPVVLPFATLTTNVVRRFELEPKLHTKVLEATRFGRTYAMASLTDGNRTATLQVRKFPEGWKLEQRQQAIRLLVLGSVTKSIANGSAQVKTALSRFQFPQIVLGHVGGSLVKETTAKGRFAEHLRFHHDTNGVSACFALVSNKLVRIKAIELISGDKIRAPYCAEIDRRADIELTNDRYITALIYLAELTKHRGEKASIVLREHSIYLAQGDQEKSVVTALALVTKHADSLTAEDCHHLEQRADNAQHPLLTALWNAEARCRNQTRKTNK